MTLDACKRKRGKLYKIEKISRNSDHWENIKTYRNKHTIQLKNNYYRTKIEKGKGDQTKMSKIIKSLLKNDKSNTLKTCYK